MCPFHPILTNGFVVGEHRVVGIIGEGSGPIFEVIRVIGCRVHWAILRNRKSWLEPHVGPVHRGQECDWVR